MTGGSPMTWHTSETSTWGLGKGEAPWQSKKLEVGKNLGTEGKEPAATLLGTQLVLHIAE